MLNASFQHCSVLYHQTELTSSEQTAAVNPTINQTLYVLTPELRSLLAQRRIKNFLSGMPGAQHTPEGTQAIQKGGLHHALLSKPDHFDYIQTHAEASSALSNDFATERVLIDMIIHAKLLVTLQQIFSGSLAGKVGKPHMRLVDHATKIKVSANVAHRDLAHVCDTLKRALPEINVHCSCGK